MMEAAECRATREGARLGIPSRGGDGALGGGAGRDRGGRLRGLSGLSAPWATAIAAGTLVAAAIVLALALVAPS